MPGFSGLNLGRAQLANLGNTKTFGATDTVPSATDAVPGSYDVAIECVGKPGLLDACIACARPRGRIVVAGTCIEPDPFMSVAALMKEVSIFFAVYYSPDEFRTVIQAFASGAIDPGPIVGATIGLEQADKFTEDALIAMMQRRQFEGVAAGAGTGHVGG